MEARNSQSGYTVLELAITIAAALAGILLGIGSEIERGFQEEISPDHYEALNKLATRSCSGADHLKSRAAAGPITFADVAPIARELEAHASRTARERIAGLSTTCGN